MSHGARGTLALQAGATTRNGPPLLIPFFGGFFELVAERLDGGKRIRKDRKFLAEMSYMHIHCAGCTEVVISPHMVEDHIARHHATFVLDQIDKQFKFF